MELWIRSQDKTTLIKSYEIYIAEYGKGSYVIRAKRTSHILGAYNSFERALKVLDEIENKIRGKFLLKPKTKLKPSTVVDAKYYFEDLNKIELIAGDINFDILPISDGVVIYEMPKE